MAAALTGRILLEKADKELLTPTSPTFKEFIENCVINYYGFSQPLEPYLKAQISEFMKDWPKRILQRFKDKKIGGHIDRLLVADYPAVLDREIRFVPRLPTPPRSPTPSGRIFNLNS